VISGTDTVFLCLSEELLSRSTENFYLFAPDIPKDFLN
jgi:hypothetical protein